MTIYVNFTNEQPAFYDSNIHTQAQIPKTAKPITVEVHQAFLANQGNKVIDPISLTVKDKIVDFDTQLKNILAEIKSSHLKYLDSLKKETQEINGLTFDLSDEFYKTTKDRIDNAKKLGITFAFSRDNNNKFFEGTIEQIEQLLSTLDQYRLKLWINQELSYIKKWLLEKPLKVCKTITELNALPKNFEIIVTEEEIQQLINMSAEQRNQYMSEMKKNFLV